jgi:hypothetical protein
MARHHSVRLVPSPASDRTPSRRPPSIVFYRRVMRTLAQGGIPFLVGGTYALGHYTGVLRPTKDLDLFVRRDSLDHALGALRRAGYRTEVTHPHFLGKAYDGATFVDVIFSSGNGSCEVDASWFTYARGGALFGLPVSFCPIEEMIWSKSYVMERERYDGHDVAHLIRSGAQVIDWPRLVARFGPHWRVLFAHLILFGFIYPGERTKVPEPIIDDLTSRLSDEVLAASETGQCRGTLLSRSQYLHDVEALGFADARVEPFGAMTPEDTLRWTRAMRRDEKKEARAHRKTAR